MPPRKKSPKRIQRRRTKGWRLPRGAKYVGRPTKWGNPFTGKAKTCVEYYRQWITGAQTSFRVGDGVGLVRIPYWEEARFLRDHLHELRGHDLVCWCREDAPWCHADVLLELANAPEQS